MFELRTCKKLNSRFGQRSSLHCVSVYGSDVRVKSFLRQSITCRRQKSVAAVFPISSLLITFRHSLLVIVFFFTSWKYTGRREKNVWRLRLAGSDHITQRRSIHDIRLNEYMNFNETWPLVALINGLGGWVYVRVSLGLEIRWGPVSKPRQRKKKHIPLAPAFKPGFRAML